MLIVKFDLGMAQNNQTRATISEQEKEETNMSFLQTWGKFDLLCPNQRGEARRDASKMQTEWRQSNPKLPLLK